LHLVGDLFELYDDARTYLIHKGTVWSERRIVSGPIIHLNHCTLSVNNSVHTPHSHANTRVGYIIIYKVLIGKPEGKRQLGKPRRRWEYNIKMDLKEVGCVGVWTGLIWLMIGTSGGHL